MSVRPTRPLLFRVATFVGVSAPDLARLRAVLRCACAPPADERDRVDCPHEAEASAASSYASYAGSWAAGCLDRGALTARQASSLWTEAYLLLGLRDDTSLTHHQDHDLVDALVCHLRIVLGPLVGTDAEAREAARAILHELTQAVSLGTAESTR